MVGSDEPEEEGRLMAGYDDQRERMGWAEPLAQVVRGTVLRGVVHRIDPAKLRASLQVELLAGDTDDDTEHRQPYGFHSVPLAPDDDGQAECVAVIIAGDQDSPLVILVDDIRHRPKDWTAGDVGLFDHRGQRVRLRDGKVEIVTDDDLAADVGGNITLGNGATAGVARIGDDAQADATSDPAFWTWFQAVATAAGAPSPPSTLTSKITTGSGTVKAKD